MWKDHNINIHSSNKYFQLCPPPSQIWHINCSPLHQSCTSLHNSLTDPHPILQPPPPHADSPWLDHSVCHMSIHPIPSHGQLLFAGMWNYAYIHFQLNNLLFPHIYVRSVVTFCLDNGLSQGTKSGGCIHVINILTSVLFIVNAKWTYCNVLSKI